MDHPDFIACSSMGNFIGLNKIKLDWAAIYPPGFTAKAIFTMNWVIWQLGPNIHGLVTYMYIQVYDYFGNKLSWLSFQNWHMLKIK